jgi:hypothetical protein
MNNFCIGVPISNSNSSNAGAAAAGAIIVIAVVGSGVAAGVFYHKRGHLFGYHYDKDTHQFAKVFSLLSVSQTISPLSL